MDGEPRLSVSITLENHRVAVVTLGASGKTTDSIIGRKQAGETSPGVQGIAVDRRGRRRAATAMPGSCPCPGLLGFDNDTAMRVTVDRIRLLAKPDQ